MTTHATTAQVCAPMRRGLGSGLRVGWSHRELLRRLVRREVEARYRGSLLGVAWAVIVPLLMLIVYTFVFTKVFQSRWDFPLAHQAEFALVLFSGLITFGIFSEAIARAPSLMLENVSYIKKVVFPLDVLPWVLVGAAVVNAGISLALLLVAYIALIGPPPISALFIPLVWAPLVLFTLGLTYFLAALGVFIRDLRQVMGVFIAMLMFLSPIFYPLSALPPTFQQLVLLSPMTALLETVRTLLFAPELMTEMAWFRVGIAGLCSVIVYVAGYLVFQRLRRGFADVV